MGSLYMVWQPHFVSQGTPAFLLSQTALHTFTFGQVFNSLANQLYPPCSSAAGRIEAIRYAPCHLASYAQKMDFSWTHFLHLLYLFHRKKSSKGSLHLGSRHYKIFPYAVTPPLSVLSYFPGYPVILVPSRTLALVQSLPFRLGGTCNLVSNQDGGKGKGIHLCPRKTALHNRRLQDSPCLSDKTRSHAEETHRMDKCRKWRPGKMNSGSDGALVRCSQQEAGVLSLSDSGK